MDQSLRSSLFPSPLCGADSTLPEARDAEYLSEVLQLTAHALETYLEDLLAKAERFGVTLAHLSSANVVSDNRNTSGAESNVTLGTSHARSVSSGSQASERTVPITSSSRNGNNIADKILKRAWTRGLSFAHYDRYLSEVEQNLDQPKLLASPATEADATPGIFGVGANKRYRSIRSSILKLRGRNWSKTARCFESATMWVNTSCPAVKCIHGQAIGAMDLANDSSQFLQRMPRRLGTKRFVAKTALRPQLLFRLLRYHD
jgi:hypothetical protein